MCVCITIMTAATLFLCPSIYTHEMVRAEAIRSSERMGKPRFDVDRQPRCIINCIALNLIQSASNTLSTHTGTDIHYRAALKLAVFACRYLVLDLALVRSDLAIYPDSLSIFQFPCYSIHTVATLYSALRLATRILSITRQQGANSGQYPAVGLPDRMRHQLYHSTHITVSCLLPRRMT